MTLFSGAVLGSLAGGSRKPAGTETPLSDQELQIFRLIGLPMPTRVIAQKLGLSIKTIEAHREHIKNKLGLESAA